MWKIVIYIIHLVSLQSWVDNFHKTESVSLTMSLSTLCFCTIEKLLTCKISKIYFKTELNNLFHIWGVRLCPTNLGTSALKFPPPQKSVYLKTSVKSYISLIIILKQVELIFKNNISSTIAIPKLTNA